MAPTLRRLDRNDIPELLQLCREHARYERASWREHESDAALASLLLDRDDVRCWVADGGDGLVGFATAMLERSTWDAARYLHLDCIYLRAAHRGQGIGQALMAEVARAAIEMGAVNVQWQTPSWNEGAVRFYDRLGASRAEKLRYTLGMDQCAALAESRPEYLGPA